MNKTLSELINEFTIEVVVLCASKGYDTSEDSEFMRALHEQQDTLINDIKNLLVKITQ